MANRSSYIPAAPRACPRVWRRAGVIPALLCSAAVVVGAPGWSAAAPAEVRGTWLTTTGPDHILSGANTESVFRDLKTIGVNTVYVEAWKNGYTNFPSPTLSALTGGPDRAPYLGSSRDLVQETLIQAHRNELNYVAWFEYGFAAESVAVGASPTRPLGVRAQQNGWLLRDQSGRVTNSSNGFAWMNPAVPEVRQFLINLALEAVDHYDLDGLQFDDRLSWPKEFGWDATTAALYLQETGRSLPASVDDANFRAWRQGKVTLFAQELTAALREAKPDLLLSVSPSVTNFSDVQYNAVWPQWQNAGLFDEYNVQVYRSTIASFESTLPGQLAQFTPSERGQLVVGLRGNGTGANTPIADLEQMILDTRAAGAAGHSIFYSKAVRDDYRTQLTAFYDVAGQGPAADPRFGADHRPAPLVASPAGASLWSVSVADDDAYRVVAKVGSLWREVTRGYFNAGPHVVNVSGASQVELLLDRRGFELPDFNGDGAVNAADYTIWADAFGSLADLRADANGDGLIDALDYEIWAAYYAQGSSATSAIPEPAAPALIVCAACAVSRLRRRSIGRASARGLGSALRLTRGLPA